MFLSNGNRDLGVTFKVHPRSQASSPVEVKNSALLSSCDGYLLEPIEWPKGVKPPLEFSERTRDCPLGPAGKEGLILRCLAKLVVFFELQHNVSGSPRFTTGNSGSVSCGPREVQSPFGMRGGAQDCSRITAGYTGLKTR